MRACKWCGQTITFMQTASGRIVPMNYADNSPHNCRDRPQHPIPCAHCGVVIQFTKSRIGANERMTPIDALTGKVHQCSNWHRYF